MKVMTLYYSEGSPLRTIQDLRNRLHAEYTEMPGLRLKAEQVQRLCGTEQTVCQLVLDSLVDEKFLCAVSDGHYARVTDRHHPPPEGRPQNRHTFQKAS